MPQNRPSLETDEAVRRGQSSPTPRAPKPQRWINVETTLSEYSSADGTRRGVQLGVRITADDDDSLWRFFAVRQSQFANEMELFVRQLSRGRATFQILDCQRGSITLVILVVSVVGVAVTTVAQYPQLKANLPVIMSELDAVFDQIVTEIIPALEQRIREFFEEYKETPIVRLGRSLWKTFFG